jgi:alanyl-tRNA synthetase
MKASSLKKSYIEFFKSKGHKEIRNSSLIPENDPTVLFTTAGMHPLVPFLLGSKHPSGKRLVNVQKCIRTGDIEEVGDNVHLTFFEMLGNWSLGDYWKEDAIKWSFEFLTDKKWLNFPIDKLAVSVFKGDKDASKDNESAKVWLELGIPKERLAYLGKKDNWWGPAGETGPCGPDSEMFYWNSSVKVPVKFDPSDSRWVEVWNDVFMQYNKTEKGFEELKQKNVDTGFGYERVFAILEGKESIYESSLMLPIVKKIKDLGSKDDELSIRIIADHIRAAVFILNEKVVPSNIEHGYVLRRLIRRSIRHGKLLGITDKFCSKIAKEVMKLNKDYKFDKEFILKELNLEEERFDKMILAGLRIFDKFSKKGNISGKDAFLLFQSYGFPIEMTEELAKEKKVKVDVKGYEKEFKKHQKLSRTASKGRFASGLADKSDNTIKLHTAAHLMLAAMNKVLGKEIVQKGSNINPERLRFDFSFDRKLTEEEVSEIEDLVNSKIKEGISVKKEEMSVAEAKKSGAHGEFESKYGEKVYVYSVGSFSKEICSGPHVKNTKELGKFKIVKQKSVGAGSRRIKAVLE